MRPTEALEPREVLDGVDHEVGRHHVEPHHRRVADERHEGEPLGLAQQPLQQEVGPVELLGVAGAGVTDDDGRPVDRRRHPAVAGRGHVDLGQELGLLVEVVERLAHVEVGLVERPAMAAADVAGADVVVAPQSRAALGEAQHVPRALDVDPHAEVAGHAEVVHRRQVPDLGHLRGQPGAVRQAEARGGEVTGHEIDAPGERGLGRLEDTHSLLGQRLELGLHEARSAGPGRPPEDAGEEARAEEPGEPGDEDGASGLRDGHPRCLGAGRPPVEWCGRSGPAGHLTTGSPPGDARVVTRPG